jgi:phosphoenolpyruvate---glycerone phosphotransferase subunit DhaK
VRKLLNDPFAIVDEMLEGVAAAYSAQVELTRSGRGIVSTHRPGARRVAIVVGGGSGHEPAFFGYIGPGFADGAAAGNVFASPSATPIVEVAERVHRDAGVLLLYGNYEGDVMNFEMAAELLAERGIPTRHVRVTDDLASAPSEDAAHRRGVAGDVLVLKVAAARADEGASLVDVQAAAAHANARTRTIGIGLGPCTVPAAGQPTFDLPDGTMDVGMGVHGEPGLSRRPLESADEVADGLLELLLAELEPDPAYVLVNTLGATPLMEGFVFLRRVLQQLRRAGVPVHRARVGEYITSLEMAGLSLTLMSLDEELRRLVDAPARAVAMPPLDDPW